MAGLEQGTGSEITWSVGRIDVTSEFSAWHHCLLEDSGWWLRVAVVPCDQCSQSPVSLLPPYLVVTSALMASPSPLTLNVGCSMYAPHCAGHMKGTEWPRRAQQGSVYVHPPQPGPQGAGQTYSALCSTVELDTCPQLCVPSSVAASFCVLFGLGLGSVLGFPF